MYKKSIKTIMVFLTAFLVLIAQPDVAVFASNDETTENSAEAVVTENSEVSGANNAETITPLNEESVIGAETENEPGRALVGSQLLGDSQVLGTFATFDGKDLAEAQTFTYTPQDIYTLARTLSIAAEFPTTAGISNAKLEIKLNNALQIKNAPGMVADSSKVWKFDASKLSTQLEGVIRNATFTPETFNGYNTGAGTLTYELAPGTQSLVLGIQLYLNPTYTIRLFGSPSETFGNVAEVRSLYTENSAEQVKATASINNITITNGGNIWNSFYQYGNQYRTQGQQSSFTIGLPSYVYSDLYGGVNVPMKELNYTLKIDNRLGINNITVSGGATLNYTRTPDASDSNYDILNLKISNFRTQVSLTFYYTIPTDLAPGTYTVFKTGAVPGYPNSLTRVDDTVISSNTIAVQTYGYAEKIIVSDPNQKQMLSINAANQTLTFQDMNADLNLLGNLQISNPNGIDVSNQSAKIDFSAYKENYGVQMVILRTPGTVKIKNLVAKTNAGNTYTLAALASTSVHNIKQADLGIANDNEYITELSWDYDGTFPAGWVSGGNNSMLEYFQSNSVVYYGKFLTPPADRKYAATVTVVETSTGANATAATQTITINSNPPTAVLGLESNLNTTQKSGTKFNAQVYTEFTNYNYPGATLRSMKGLAYYLRNTEYATIDPSTIAVTWNGHTYAVNDGTLVPVEGVDSSGNTFYKLELPDVILGSGNPNNTEASYPSVRLNYSFKIKPAAPTTSISSQDMVMATPLDTNIKVADSAGWFTTFFTKDKFALTGNTATQMSASRQVYSFNIEAQKDFLVTTAANLNNGPWVSYDYETGQSIIDLNPNGNAKYQLAVINNSGQPVTGYSALIPIPKYGEQTSLTPATPAQFDPSVHLQKEAFTWTASLLQELDLSNTNLNYEVLYATSYETEKDSSAFKPWDQIADKEAIRMVKISTLDTIIDGTNDTITFPLALTDPLADAHAGNTNIYSARIFRSIDGTAGYKPSEPIAIRLKTGIVSGVVFNDTNRNGLQDAGETGRNGVSVIAYEQGTTNQLASTTTTTIDNIDGAYHFMGLDKNQKVDIVFVNPNIDDSTRFSPVTSNGSTPTEAPDHLKAKKADVIPSSTDSLIVNAGIITPTVITLDTQGGQTADSTIKRYPGEAITTMPSATKSGYTFIGWATAATGGSIVTFPYTAGTLDATLYARYTVNQYTASFDIAANGGEGTTPAGQTVNFDTALSQPADPVKTNYTFTGWYTAASGGEKWNFTTDMMPAENITLYAQFTINQYTASFDIAANGGEGAAPVSQTIDYGGLISQPADASKTGHTFVGWYTAATGGNQWNFATDTMPAGNIVLYAQFNVNSYIATFDNQGTTTTAAVNYGALVPQPPTEPTKPGYDFSGWYTGNNVKWNFMTDTMPANNMTLTAKFQAVNQTISLDVNGGNATSVPATIVQPTDSPVDLDSYVPTYAGYTFIGWFDADGNQYSGTISMPIGGLQLTARWSAADQVISFNSAGGSGVNTIVAPTDSTVDLTDIASTRWSYDFLGWFDAAGNQYNGSITVPAGGLQLTAHWRDLIADGTWTINAHDFRMTYTELQAFISAGTLEQEILTRSQASAYDNENNASFEPLHVRNIEAIASNPHAGEYTATIAYTNPDADNQFTIFDNNQRALATDITVTVIDNRNTSGNNTEALPSSGQNTLFMAFIGAMVSGIAAVGILLSRKRQSE